MGTYMGIGIVAKIYFRKSDIENMELDIENIKDKLEANFDFSFDIYNLIEEDETYIFRLKDNILEEQLKPFLEEIYPQLYSNVEDYNDTLTRLENLSADKIITLAKENSKETFQYDEYGYNDYIYGKFRKKVAINYETIMISMEGKISMETYGKHFDFFKKVIIKAYPQYKISNALRIYITG
ncbi:MAG: hypothetical protein QM493_02705 [Sulfurovum sp.]